jgi:3D (Asp-Asp-Asp) domain-containing protein
MIVKLILLGTLTVTSYRPIAAQTKPDCKGRFNCTTAIDDGITKYGLAVSQDMLKDGRVHYGDSIYVDGYGWKIVNDCMAARHRDSVDIMVFTKAEEKAVGVRHLKVWVVKRDS